MGCGRNGGALNLDGAHYRVVFAAIDVVASRILVLGHAALPFASDSSADHMMSWLRDEPALLPGVSREACLVCMRWTGTSSGVFRLLNTWDCQRPTMLPSQGEGEESATQLAHGNGGHMGAPSK